MRRIAGWLFASWGAGSFLRNVVVTGSSSAFGFSPLACVGILLQALAVWPLVAETPAAVVGVALASSRSATGSLQPVLTAIAVVWTTVAFAFVLVTLRRRDRSARSSQLRT